MRDAEIVETELMLADLDSLEKRLPNLEKRAKGGDKEAAAEAPVVQNGARRAARRASPRARPAITAEERPVFAAPAAPHRQADAVRAATSTRPRPPTGNAHSARRAPSAPSSAACRAVVISAAIEAEVAQLPPRTRREYLGDARPRARPASHRVIRAGYELLDLVTFFTVGPEGGARLDGAPRAPRAPEAAGVIHTDFEKGFIRAETIAYDDYVTPERRGGRQGRRQAAARRQGLRRQGRRRHALPLQRLAPGRLACSSSWRNLAQRDDHGHFPAKLKYLTGDPDYIDYRPAVDPTGKIVIFERTATKAAGNGPTTLQMIDNFDKPSPVPFLSST